MEKAMAHAPEFLPGKSHGRKSLVGCSPCSSEESDMTERLHFHFSLSCIGEGNGNPLQCSCLETPRDSGRLLSMGPHRVRHDWSDLAAAANFNSRLKLHGKLVVTSDWNPGLFLTQKKILYTLLGSSLLAWLPCARARSGSTCWLQHSSPVIPGSLQCFG